MIKHAMKHKLYGQPETMQGYLEEKKEVELWLDDPVQERKWIEDHSIKISKDITDSKGTHDGDVSVKGTDIEKNVEDVDGNKETEQLDKHTNHIEL